jgi:hypothetical protein
MVKGIIDPTMYFIIMLVVSTGVATTIGQYSTDCVLHWIFVHSYPT